MTLARLLSALTQSVHERAYLRRVDIMEQSEHMLKVRLYVVPGLFVQVYRNDRFDTTNFALIHNGRRIFGRDYLGGHWHRHPLDAPESHDRSADGQRSVDLDDFLDEVEAILGALDLP